MSEVPYLEEVIEKEKNSESSKRLFNQDEHKLEEIVKLQEKAFLRQNNNHQLAYFSELADLKQFIQKTLEGSNRLTDQELKKEGKAAEHQNLDFSNVSFPEGMEHVGSCIFFNPKSGIEIIYGFNEMISDPANPYYNKEQSEDNLFVMLKEKTYSAELVKWLLEHQYISRIAFPGPTGDQLVKENLDFLLRYWKQDNYFSKPEITLQ